MPSQRTIWAACVCCGKMGYHEARGLRLACYSRWKRRGLALKRFPTVRKAGSYDLREPAAIQQAWQYAELITGRGACSRERACIVLSISTRTAIRYERYLGMKYRKQVGHGRGGD
jgi:hypothetical protein